MPFSEAAVADRFSTALSELGEAAIQMIKDEREACAKVVENMLQQKIATHALIQGSDLADAARAIRSRQPD